MHGGVTMHISWWIGEESKSAPWRVDRDCFVFRSPQKKDTLVVQTADVHLVVSLISGRDSRADLLICSFFFSLWLLAQKRRRTLAAPPKRTGAIPTHLPMAPNDKAKRSEARSPAEAGHIYEKERRNRIIMQLYWQALRVNELISWTWGS